MCFPALFGAAIPLGVTTTAGAVLIPAVSGAAAGFTGLTSAGLLSGLSFGSIFQGFGLVFDLAGQVAQNRALKAQARFDAAVADRNQVIAQRAADDLRERGQVSADVRRQQISQLIGVQRASLAGAGVELGIAGDTAGSILADTAQVGAIEVANIEATAERAALEAETRGSNFAAAREAALFRAESTSSLGLIATGLSGVSEISRRFGRSFSNRIV